MSVNGLLQHGLSRVLGGSLRSHTLCAWGELPGAPGRLCCGNEWCAWNHGRIDYYYWVLWRTKSKRCAFDQYAACRCLASRLLAALQHTLVVQVCVQFNAPCGRTRAHAVVGFPVCTRGRLATPCVSGRLAALHATGHPAAPCVCFKLTALSSVH